MLNKMRRNIIWIFYAMNHNKVHCGYVAIIGRPNVGKSTLLNQILGEKLSITSRKPQTTRHQILGIKTQSDVQTIYVDTPGLHQTGTAALNRYLNRAASSAIHDVDVLIWVIDATRWTADDDWVLEKLKTVKSPVLLVVNKVDKIKEKKMLLPLLERLGTKLNFAAIIPLSAKTGQNVALLEGEIATRLPAQAYIFPEEQLTDRSERFLASEIIREKLVRTLGQELPYAISVEIEQFKVVNTLYEISAIIWIEKNSQKPIILGKKGEQLKAIGTAARLDMERLFDHKVFLRLWVKVKSGWSDDERALRSLGYD